VAGELFLPNCCLGFAKATQLNSVAHQTYSAFSILTPFVVINPVAVADIEAALATVAPDRVLDEPGKGLRKFSATA
jgi:hypothetical protein